jgi:serine/threonine protein kinase
MLAAGAGEGASFWGTLEYVAPEVVQFGAAAYSPAADWWGLGVLIYELLLGLVPWDGSDADQIMDQIKAADVVWPPQGMVSRGSRHGYYWSCMIRQNLIHNVDVVWPPQGMVSQRGRHFWGIFGACLVVFGLCV